MNAYITGSYGPGNIGDDVLMLASLKLVTNIIPRSRVAVGVRYPEIAEKWYPGVQWQRRGYFSEYEADIAVYGGGGQFYSFPLTPFRQGYKRYIRQFSRLFDRTMGWRELVRALTRRASGYRNVDPAIRASYRAAFCVGVGPFVPDSREIGEAKKTLRSCGLVSVRDQSSKAYCDAWGLSDVRVRTDPCFARALWTDSATDIERRGCEEDSIAFIVRAWPHSEEGQRYLVSMLHAVEILRSKGIEIRFVLLHKEQDSKLFRYLKSEDVLCWDPVRSEPGEFVRSIASSFSMVVSARAHGVMLPAVFGVPGICVAVEPKLKVVHEMLPAGTMIWEGPFCEHELVDMIEHMLADRERFGNHIQDEVKNNEKIAMQAADELLDWLKSVKAQ